MNKILRGPREIRQGLGMTQQEFWNKIGVTQSGGSRYERGRALPKPIKELLRLVYIERIDLTKLNKADVDVVNYLHKNNPDLYHTLLNIIQGNSRET